MSAVELKDQGNKFFAARKYDDAVSCYTKAIVKNGSTATYFTNRALCYLRLKQWELAIQDCRRALELNRSLVKGHYFIGLALMELNMHDEAIASLKRAHELAKEQKLHFGDDITGALRQAKRKRWNQMEEKRIQQEIELQTYLNKLITEDSERQISAYNGTEEDRYEHIQKMNEDKEKRLQQVNQIISQIDDRRKKRDVPDFLCGRISFELMRDPVITPSGITYDRKDILEHLQRVGHFDPVTRTDLTHDQLIPNLAMKEVVDNYLEENPWAEEY
ncbi:hypothetical protein CHS0354_033225 [Potamilus streckersoni]|uniref:E3 ubiquitin-protein ligase CHIP n=1 Tax=Potamilus streckersoni TaxID=2493646 RepID=A0AAE0S755_9BIVA|nr:hypothetical protein CHS0354_033225 [Potamilus streckersoni]